MESGKQRVDRRKLFSILAIIVFIVFSAAMLWFVGRPMLKFVSEPEKFRAWVDSHGIGGRFAFIGMMALQVVVALIPGEPLEVGAGYAFGAIEGTIVCLVGAVIGSAVVFLFVKYFGIRAVEVFYPREKLLSLKFLRDSKRFSLLLFIIFLIPGTPKDVLTYFVGLTPMKLSAWLFISGVARIPSVVTSTISGNALGLQNYVFAAIAFGATALLSGVGWLLYRSMSAVNVKEKVRLKWKP